MGRPVGSITLPAGAKSASLSAVITRADGRVENLGLVAYGHRNPLVAFVVKLLGRLR